MFYNQRIRKLVKKWPGNRYFGVYRFLPLFFFLGAGLEFSMIKWHVGQVNFYNTYKRRKVDELVQQKLQAAKVTADHHA